MIHLICFLSGIEVEHTNITIEYINKTQIKIKLNLKAKQENKTNKSKSIIKPQ